MPEYLMVGAEVSSTMDSETYILVYDAREMRKVARYFKSALFHQNFGVSARIDPLALCPLDKVEEGAEKAKPPLGWLLELAEEFASGSSWVMLAPEERAQEFNRIEERIRRDCPEVYMGYALRTPESSDITFFVVAEYLPIVNVALRFEEIENPLLVTVEDSQKAA